MISPPPCFRSIRVCTQCGQVSRLLPRAAEVAGGGEGTVFAKPAGLAFYCAACAAPDLGQHHSSRSL